MIFKGLLAVIFLLTSSGRVVSNTVEDDLRSATYCPSIPPPPVITQPTMPPIIYSPNCDFCDHDLYNVTCIPDAFDCASRCAYDSRCSHFTHIANVRGGTCLLKRSIGSGGAWATVVAGYPSPYTCGLVRKRAFNQVQLNLCIGLDTAFGIV